MTTVYELQEVKTNPRDGSSFGMAYDTFPSLSEAKAAARKNLKGRRWAIVKSEIVARSMDDE